MAEFLRTSGISHHIEEIIIKAKEKLIIVSPFLKLTDNLFERLKEKDSQKIKIVFVYGKNELNEKEKEKLYNLKSLNLYYYKNLHAKCYFNESEMLITSMNLYEFSEKNNREMGILIDKTSDSSIFENALQETDSIIKAALIEKKANLLLKYKNTIPDFEYRNEGNITLWLEKIHFLLIQKYSLEFMLTGNGTALECSDFINKKVRLLIEPEMHFMRIVFQFNGRNKKDLFYLVLANTKNIFETSFPSGIVNWGNQMMRIKLDIPARVFPTLFKYDKTSLVETIQIISESESIISKQIKNLLD